MTPTMLLRTIIRPALTLLPERMTSPQAERMLVAVAIHETALRHRRQVGGPARGWWQFELGGGVAGILRHRATQRYAREACAALVVQEDAESVYGALEHCDLLAGVFARLNVWWLPRPLPETEQEGWEQYLEAWRPGRPRPEGWPGAWQEAHGAVADAAAV